MAIDSDHRAALPVGHHLEEYRVEAVLGHGGFGITYRAWDGHLDQWVAIKEYLPSDFALRQGLTVRAKTRKDEEAYTWGLERFLEEAKTLARFRHPSLIKVHRFLHGHGTAYMVMEYAEGDPLDRILEREPGHPAQDEVERLAGPLLEALEVVHRAGVLHRDIKPANIYIREDGVPVLLDFGAARQAVGVRSRSMTSIVTPGYAPIEQYHSGGKQGAWTDIYGLGATLYRVLSGQPPPEAPGRLLEDTYVPATGLGLSGYTAALLAAIDASLEVRPEARPQSIEAWREALERPQTKRVRSRSPTPPDATRAPAKPGRARAVVAAAVAGVAVVAAAVLFTTAMQEKVPGEAGTHVVRAMSAGSRLAIGDLEFVAGAADGEPSRWEDVRGGCLAVDVAGKRKLSWAHLGLCPGS